MMIDKKTSGVFRGIAILMVIASHYAGWMLEVSPFELFKNWISTWGVYGVDIFFMLSGYGLVKAYEKSGINGDFVLGRVLNSYVPYILIAGILAAADGTIDGPMAVIKLLIGFDYWFMCILFAFYIMFMVFYRIGVAKELLLTLGVIGFSFALNAGGMAYFWVVSNGAFLIGVYAATLDKEYGRQFSEICVKYNLALVLYAAMVAAAFWHGYSQSLAAHNVASMLFTLMALCLCVQFKAEGYVLPLLGRHSIYIYLLHTRLFWLITPGLLSRGYLAATVVAGIVTLIVGVIIGAVMELCFTKVRKKVCDKVNNK